jgi:hypothetical protein
LTRQPAGSCGLSFAQAGEGADAESELPATHIDIDRVPVEGILDAERIRIEKAKDGQGTVFNRNNNGQGLGAALLRRAFHPLRP